MFFCAEEQVAGAKSVEFFLLEESAGWPEVVSDANASAITFTPEDVEVNGSIVPDSISIQDDPKSGDEGTTWPIELAFTFLIRGVAMEQLLEQYANRPGVAVVCLNDGTRKLYGTDKQPLYLSWKNNYGTKAEDGHGVNVAIRGTMLQRPSFILE